MPEMEEGFVKWIRCRIQRFMQTKVGLWLWSWI